jgi:hypothetical protein
MVSGFDINSRINSTYPLHIAVQNVGLIIRFQIAFLESSNFGWISILKWGSCGRYRSRIKYPTTYCCWNGIHTVCVALFIPLFIFYFRIVYQLVKRNGDKSLKNAHGETALDLAVAKQHANIVTLLVLFPYLIILF